MLVSHPHLAAAKVVVPEACWFAGEISAGARAALDLAIGALQAAGATVQTDDPAFATFNEKLGAAKTLYPGGPAVQRREMDGYIGLHDGLKAAGVTVDTVVDKIHWCVTSRFLGAGCCYLSVPAGDFQKYHPGYRSAHASTDLSDVIRHPYA